MLNAPPALTPGLNKVILHIDLDCFYCQVEQKRLSIPREVPCAVQQWDGLIAVNYAARAAGVTRHMRVAEARNKCPELQLVHVQTIGGFAEPNNTDDATPAATFAISGGAVPGNKGTEAAANVEGIVVDRGSSKACLQRYRRASAEILRLLGQMCPGCLIEKASIDEAYLDITPMVVRVLHAAENPAAGDAAAETLTAVAGSTATGVDGGSGVLSLVSDADGGSVVLGQGGLQQDIDFDRLAAAGAVIALRLRAAMLSQLGFTASAGVGPNKLLAKIGSAMNKPNKQTLVLPRAVEGLMQDLPIGKVKGLGGKLGGRLEELGVATAGAAAALAWDTLLAHFGPKASWVYRTVRGVDDEPVTPKNKVKSINSCKSFNATSDPAAVCQWLAVLAAELADRMAEDQEEHSRRARNLVLQYKGGAGPATGRMGTIPNRSIRGPMPLFNARDTPNPGLIAAAALALFKRIKPAPWPLCRLALVATEFLDMASGASGSNAAMARFLSGSSSGQQQQQQQQWQDQQATDPAGQTQQQLFGKQHAECIQAAASGQQSHECRDAANTSQQAIPRQRKVHKQAQQQQLHLQQFLIQPEQPQQPEQEQGQAHLQHVQPQQPQQQHIWEQQLVQPLHEQYQALQLHLQLHPSQEQAHQQQLLYASTAATAPVDSMPQQQQQHQLSATADSAAAEMSTAAIIPAAAAADGVGAASASEAVPAVQQTVGRSSASPAQQLLAGVNLAEQARIMRDIEVQGLLQRHKRHQLDVGQKGGASSKKRQSNAHQGQGRKRPDSKQVNITSLIGKVGKPGA